jgi:hypothetical protein
VTSTVYPTGTTIYNPEQCWNGYTLFPATLSEGKLAGAVLIDMNGNVVNQWEGLDGLPNKMLPGGYIMGSTGQVGVQDMIDVVQCDWDGEIVWKFYKYALVGDSGRKPEWIARQHHDYQREGNPVGYYVPGMDPLIDRGNTHILCHKELENPKISDKPLLDDAIIEVTWDGMIVWEWICSDHFDEMGFDDEAKSTIKRNPSLRTSTGGQKVGDWTHMNSMSLLGPNKWFDAGDKRFAPGNIIWSGRNTNIIAIVDKATSKIVWQVGPDFTATEELRKLKQIVGQHHAHIIPKGLPGEGNILVFDNGGGAGYGAPNPSALTGTRNAVRDYSRVLEFDPTTLAIVWQYTPNEAGFIIPMNAQMFYSSFVSAAQRLPNGNTLITEGAGGRILEVTPQHDIVWEYLSPYRHRTRNMNLVYRAYRVPYEWVPQVDKPEHRAIARIDNNQFRVPGSLIKEPLKTTTVAGAKEPSSEVELCVVPETENT